MSRRKHPYRTALTLIWLLAACTQNTAEQPSPPPVQAAPPAASAETSPAPSKKSASDDEIRKDAALQTLAYAQAVHCGNATLMSVQKPDYDRQPAPEEAALLLDKNTDPETGHQEAYLVVLYQSDITPALAMLPEKAGEQGIYGCSAGSGTSSLYLMAAVYNSDFEAVGIGGDLLDEIAQANQKESERHENDPQGNPYYINPRFILSVKHLPEANSLEIISLQHADGDANNFPTLRRKYTVNLYSKKITASKFDGIEKYEQSE
ncbi:MAG: hypothetical protein Q3966_07900 [Neisseria sp.]|nr:hypothetical protein [Neisseria sp.]